MFDFRHKDSGAVYGVLIDISSGTVGVAIVASERSEKLPRLIYTHRITMRVTKHGAEKSENVRRVRESLLSASLVLSQEGMSTLLEHDPKAKISKLYVTCSSPWSYTIARTVHFENDEPFKIDTKLIGDLIQGAESEILTYIESIPHVDENAFTIVERATVDLSANDYPIRDPLGHKATMLGLTHIAGLIPEEILSSVREVQEKLFPHTELRPHTYMLVMYCVLRDIFPRVNDMCIIDITGEATEFALVENNLLTENAFIPEGSNTFIRNAMDTSGKPAPDIQSYMTQNVSDSHLDIAELKDHVASYAKNIAEAIERIREHRVLPSHVIITVQRPYEQFFTPIIERVFKDALKSNPKILSIRQSLIDEISQGAGDDVYLALGARFFHKLHGCGELDYK